MNEKKVGGERFNCSHTFPISRIPCFGRLDSIVHIPFPRWMNKAFFLFRSCAWEFKKTANKIAQRASMNVFNVREAGILGDPAVNKIWSDQES